MPKQNSGNDDSEQTPIDFSFVLASSVHDMKNSLGMLLNTLSAMMANSPPKDAEQAQFFSVLEYEAARINGELVQLLSLYRMDENTMSVVIDQHYVSDIIDEQIARNDTLLKSRNIDVQVNCDSNLVWYFDNELIGGVLNNLIVNCARYSRKQLRLTAIEEGNFLCISIADDGQGYPDNMLMGAVPQTPVSFSSGNTRLGLLFTGKVLELHKSKKGQGYMTIANNGPLGGGVLTLHLP
ncbi:sensor histidine kinase [Cellvibrio sp. OA-2007]|uniref:sensor histidine kinase n=1 Tax=Cellvibrio sp. OA-2007 TaxID=529823 RepID=UPI00078411B1|nr:HAMP domain-containing sensor histidine kinase [Cellvibrio sp. OA-2007]